ncbi:MAG: glycine cleavage system aminomethyltransferase GcvT [Corynebacterium sp.]|uniref:glycine cleavage system aminomethyltransferase GcvT n=1 Tax=Corynebacterium sp. TaxID=1720 RepID=UPI0026E01E8C|nr:glycine cleavage system aminomethyltransferase GcvT [Corynebacterium sp.]MDO5669100.1 glycine cleavage system aminomethyltransferase GcvT [Corynebacterium sp.]
MSDLRTSPLHERHEDLGATFTPFGPWTMPLKYGNELDEHRAVRSSAGLFDLSHMGEIRVRGPQAGEFLDYALISTLSTIPVGKAKYSMIVNAEGGILDDLISYRLAEDEYLVVPNAGNTDVVWSEFQDRAADFDVELTNESLDTALIAVQGPRAEELIADLVAGDDETVVRGMKYYSAAPVTVAGYDTLLARTGYTGEDGYELYLPNAEAGELWDALLNAGAAYDLLPAGLAARDSLRLEAGMPLYGQELGTDITPVEAGMARAFATKESDFVGRQALAGREATSAIVGLKGLGRRAAREGADVYRGDERVGVVTSGQPSPVLGHPIALARLQPDATEVGTELEVDIRGKRHPVVIVKLPFYTRAER